MKDHEETPLLSIAEWILLHLRKNAGKEKIAQIFVDDDSSMTYEDLLRDSIYVAEGLKALGFKSGDLVSITARSSHEIFPIIFGFMMNDVLIAINEVELNIDQLNQNFVQIKPQHIVTVEAKISDVKEATTNFNPQPRYFDVHQLFKEAKEKGSKADIDNFQPIKIANPKTHSFACFFSSGTTGPQKAVLVNDYGYLRSVYLACRFAEKFEGPLMITSQPYWTTWWLNLFRAIRHCRTRIFVDKCSYEIMADAIHKYKPDVWYGVPQAMGAVQKAIQQNPGKWDTSSLKLIVSTGDYCDPTTTTNFMHKLKVNIVQEYGSTEMCLPVANPLDCPPVLGSIGKPTRPFKLVDIDTGEVVNEPNKPGELRVQWTAMNGYVNNPEATRTAFDDDGWYKTGDLVYFNENGYLFIVERLKDLFKHYGYSIGPGDIEAIIRKMPQVNEAVVVGRKMKDYNVGEAPAAFIVKAPNSNLTEKDVHDFFEKENVHYTRKLGGGIFFVDEIPKNCNGKVLRRSLRERLRNLPEV